MQVIVKGLFFLFFVGVTGAFAQVGNPRGISLSQTGKNAPPEVPPPAASSIPTAKKNTGASANPEEEGAESTDEESPNFTRPQNSEGVQLGRFQTSGGYVKMVELILNSYKNSVVRVSALDESGKVIREAMGVAVGLTDSGLQVGDSNYIATSLSLILGNELQWADRIEITHDTNTKYTSEIALIDEQLDLVLLKPKNKPTPIRFVTENQERAQVDIITISFDRDRKNDVVPNAHRGVLAAINSDDGTLAISGKTINSSQAGTGIINMQGQLMGMLLPNGNGVLSSAIRKAIEKAKGKTPFHPRLVGMITGRGVLVDPNIPGAFPTIEEAIQAIQKKLAPKADLDRFHPAKNDLYRPKLPPRTILKIAPGTFSVKKNIVVPNKITITGSGPNSTTIVGLTTNRPIFSVIGVKRVTLNNFRIVPNQTQEKNTPTIEVLDSEQVSILSSIIESKGGRSAVYARNTKKIFLAGNSFPEGKMKAVYCQGSSLQLEANAFLGKWPQSIAVGKDCEATAVSNLFIDNEIAIAVSGAAKRIQFTNNTFIRGIVGARFYGMIPDLLIEDNLFYGNRYSVLTVEKINPKLVGRNSAWQSVAFHQNEAIVGLDFIKGKPLFQNPDKYDFRLLPGSPGAASGVPDEDGNPTDVGAFQRGSFLNDYTPDFILSLETAIGQKNLAEAWGYKLEAAKGE